MTTPGLARRLCALVGTALAVFALNAHAVRLNSISTRMQVRSDAEVLIGGFIISGPNSKTVLVRARGPSLIPAGITNALADPQMFLVRSADQQTIATNDNWQDAANASDILATGFAPTDPLESAVLITLSPGAYTAVVSGVGGVTGIGIVEIIEVDHPEAPLTGISTRGSVSVGNDVMIGGFIIQGDSPQRVIVRARGPSLTAAGITNALQNPVLTVVRAADQAVMAVNDNWGQSNNALGAATPAEISASGFAPSNNQESAILMNLAPGAYTAIVSGVGNTTGVAIIEVYAAISNLANANTSAVHQGVLGQTYVYNLPRYGPGQTGGMLSQSDNPGTPTELTVEWALSRTPGDFDYYKSPEGMRSGPCGGVNGASTGSYFWSIAGSFYECQVDSASAWYVSVRYLDHCPPGQLCPISYYHVEH